MRFLRKRNDEIQYAWMPDQYTARDKAKALHILSGSVALLRHPYERSPHSGAGNCWCGSDQRSKI